MLNRKYGCIFNRTIIVKTIERENIGWVDMLRVTVCFFAVFSHSCDPFVAHFDAGREMFVTGVFTGSLVRPCMRCLQ